MGQQFFKANGAAVDAAMRARFQRAMGIGPTAETRQREEKLRAKRVLRAAAKLLRDIAIGVSDETEVEAKLNVPAEPETAEPSDILQGSAVGRQLDNSSIPQRQRTHRPIWTIDSDSFREQTFSAPHLRRPKSRELKRLR